MNDIDAIAEMLTDDPDVFSEKKWIQKAVDPKKKGMFKDTSLTEINAEIKALKKKNKERKGKVPESAKERMSQLQFAKRGKSKGGLV